MDIKDILKIPVYDNDDMEPEEFDELTLQRYTIKNYKKSTYNFKNYYIFKIFDPTSSTGYSGMAINKEFAKKIQEIYGKH